MPNRLRAGHNFGAVSSVVICNELLATIRLWRQVGQSTYPLYGFTSTAARARWHPLCLVYAERCLLRGSEQAALYGGVAKENGWKALSDGIGYLLDSIAGKLPACNTP